MTHETDEERRQRGRYGDVPGDLFRRAWRAPVATRKAAGNFFAPGIALVR